MIVQKPYIEHPGRLIHTYSSTNMKIKQVETGIIYDSAVDVFPCRYTYVETDIPVEQPIVPSH